MALHKVSQTDIKDLLRVIRLHIDNIKKEYVRLPENNDPVFLEMMKDFSRQCNNMNAHLLNYKNKG